LFIVLYPNIPIIPQTKNHATWQGLMLFQ